MWLWQDYLKYRVALRKQAKAREVLDKEFPPDESEELTSSRVSDYAKREDDLLHWRWLIHTEYLRNKVDVLDTQTPNITEPGMYGWVEWDDDPEQPYHLTEKGIRATRDAIRVEGSHRRQTVGYWFGMVMTSIAAVTELVSVFRGQTSHHKNSRCLRPGSRNRNPFAWLARRLTGPALCNWEGPVEAPGRTFLPRQATRIPWTGVPRWSWSALPCSSSGTGRSCRSRSSCPVQRAVQTSALENDPDHLVVEQDWPLPRLSYGHREYFSPAGALQLTGVGSVGSTWDRVKEGEMKQPVVDHSWTRIVETGGIGLAAVEKKPQAVTELIRTIRAVEGEDAADNVSHNELIETALSRCKQFYEG